MKNNLENIHLVKEKDFFDFSANYLKEKFKSLSNQNTINVALSGGSTPLPILEILRNYNLDWKKFNFFLVDERVVPVYSTESNYKNINDVFFKYLKSKNFPVLKENLDLDTLVSQYNNQIKEHLPLNDMGFPVFDLIILGMGEDGHTASLFPGTEGLLNNSDTVIKNYIPQLESTRVTLTFPVIQATKEIIVLIKGHQKIKVFKEAIEEKNGDYPISKLIDSNIKWIIGE